MAIRGRKPKPKGDAPAEGARKTPANQAEIAIPEAPEHLDKFGRQHWEYYVPLLVERGLFSPLDHGPFTLVCEAWSIYMRCRPALKQGLTMKTKTGYQQQRPQYSMMQQAWNSYTKLAEQFGLTPVSRGRLDLVEGAGGGGAGPGGDDQDVDEYLD